MFVNVNPSSLSKRQAVAVKQLKGKSNPEVIKNCGSIFETINGNHRREMGDVMKSDYPDLYETTQFKCGVYVSLPDSLAWKLASKANMDSSLSLKNSFEQNVIATREVI